MTITDRYQGMAGACSQLPVQSFNLLYNTAKAGYYLGALVMYTPIELAASQAYQHAGKIALGIGGLASVEAIAYYGMNKSAFNNFNHYLIDGIKYSYNSINQALSTSNDYFKQATISTFSSLYQTTININDATHDAINKTTFVASKLAVNGLSSYNQTPPASVEDFQEFGLEVYNKTSNDINETYTKLINSEAANTTGQALYNASVTVLEKTTEALSYSNETFYNVSNAALNYSAEMYSAIANSETAKVTSENLNYAAAEISKASLSLYNSTAEAFEYASDLVSESIQSAGNFIGELANSDEL